MPDASLTIPAVLVVLSSAALAGVPVSAPPSPSPTAARTAALPAGFRGLVWGSPVLPDMRPLPETSQIAGIRRYMRPSDSRRLGPVGIDGPVYGFIGGRLQDVSYFIEPGDVAALRLYLEKEWGPAESVNVLLLPTYRAIPARSPE